MPVLQDVTERPRRIDVERRGGLRRDPRADDEVQQAPQRREEEIAEADEAARTRRSDGAASRSSGRRGPLSGGPRAPFSGGGWR